MIALRGRARAALAAALVALTPTAVAAAAVEPTTAQRLSTDPPVPGRAASAHRTITTRVPAAQTAFDDGLLALYAFDIGASREDFAHAGRLDPDCAACAWGEALTEITDINVETDTDGLARGRAAIARATRAREASPDERALIAAARLRFAAGGTDAARRTAYESAMRRYAATHPGDVDGLVETAFAIWKAEPNLTNPTAAEIGGDLDRAIAADPYQLGARHLRIHFEEETHRAVAALPDANLLAAENYSPGLSHLAHMPGHIYDRLGMYGPMTATNEAALANDAAYFAAGDGPGQAYMHGYHPHDVAFVLYGTTTLGENARAVRVAAAETPNARARVALRLHDWHGALASGTTDPLLLGVAKARLGDLAGARADLAELTEARVSDTTERTVSRQLVLGAIATEEGAVAEAEHAYHAAYTAFGDDLGDPKDFWATPVGEAYGAALLREQRYPEAERIFDAELGRYPDDPRLLLGRRLAREGQGVADEADAVHEREIWRGTTPLTLADLG